MTPNENISVRSSTSSPLNCSVDMYPNVPITTPGTFTRDTSRHPGKAIRLAVRSLLLAPYVGNANRSEKLWVINCRSKLTSVRWSEFFAERE